MTLSQHKQEWDEKYDAMCERSPDSYYEGFVGKNGTEYENVISGIKEIKKYIAERERALLEAVVKMLRSEMTKHEGEDSSHEDRCRYGWRALSSLITNLKDEIKR